jgi:hypothetical protein
METKRCNKILFFGRNELVASSFISYEFLMDFFENKNSARALTLTPLGAKHEPCAI